MDAWSRFWQQGHTTTFGDYFEEGYAGPVKTWLDSLKDHLGPEASSLRVLELCCGNGSLVPFLVSLNRPFTYTGVDAANVSLPTMVRDAATHSQGSIEMVPNTPVEALPESITGIDCCLSIYGIEYSELPTTLDGTLARMQLREVRRAHRTLPSVSRLPLPRPICEPAHDCTSARMH